MYIIFEFQMSPKRRLNLSLNATQWPKPVFVQSILQDLKVVIAS